MRFHLHRFPTSSELVVTPERQNTFAGLKGAGGVVTNSVTSASWTKLTQASGTLTRTTFGKAKVETNNDYSITIENMPVGNYYISTTGIFQARSSVAGDTTPCFFGSADSATGGAQIASMQVVANGDTSIAVQDQFGSTFGGVYNNTSVANRTFFIQAYRAGGGGSCFAYSDTNRPLTISVIPLDQPSNSALYVQGPVLGAQTGAAIPTSYIGEVLTNIANATNIASGTTRNCGQLTLQPGVWDLSASQGTGFFTSNPTVTQIDVGISTTSATFGSFLPSERLNTFLPATSANTGIGPFTVGPLRVNVITATTYYCVSKITASGNVDYQPSLLKAVRVN
jgi:hypothetical protein